MIKYEASNNLVSSSDTPFVSVEEFSMNAKISSNKEIQMMLSLVATATQAVEKMSGKCLSENVYEHVLSGVFSCERVVLVHTPIKRIESIQYFDEENILREMDISSLHFVQSEDQCYIEPQKGESWPILFDRRDALKIRYAVGYPDSIQLPLNLKQAIILLATHWYESRSAVGANTHEIPFGVEALVNQSKIGFF